MNRNRLTIPIHGNIIFGYPPQLPEHKEVILSGIIYENHRPLRKFHQFASKSWKKVKRNFTRTGVRASSKA